MANQSQRVPVVSGSLGGGQGVMGLGPGGLRQWLWVLEKKVQDKKLFKSMYTSPVQDLLKDGHIARAT